MVDVTQTSAGLNEAGWRTLERVADKRMRRLKRNRTLYLVLITILSATIATLLGFAFAGVAPASDGGLEDLLLQRFGIGHAEKLIIGATPLACSALALVHTVVKAGHMIEDLEIASIFLQSRDTQGIDFLRHHKPASGGLFGPVVDFFSKGF